MRLWTRVHAAALIKRAHGLKHSLSVRTEARIHNKAGRSQTKTKSYRFSISTGSAENPGVIGFC
jgi:hypothetical protein